MTEQTQDNQVAATSAVEQTLRAINEAWVAALIQKDTATLGRLMDDRCVFTDALTGEDKAEFIADIEAGEMQVTTLSRDNVEIRVYGTTAIMMALDSAEWEYKGRQMKGYYRTLHVYAQSADGWHIVAIQSSHIDSQ